MERARPYIVLGLYALSLAFAFGEETGRRFALLFFIVAAIGTVVEVRRK
jgi:hypothetical protein